MKIIMSMVIFLASANLFADDKEFNKTTVTEGEVVTFQFVGEFTVDNCNHHMFNEALTLLKHDKKEMAKVYKLKVQYSGTLEECQSNKTIQQPFETKWYKTQPGETVEIFHPSHLKLVVK